MGPAALQRLNVAIAVAAIGMDADDDSERGHSSKHARESGNDSTLDMGKNNDEPHPKGTRNGKYEAAYSGRTVSVPFSMCAYK